ncbi:sensor histidine kinase [Teredinibacter purpureus]|uniref:sensor histidine kinase n=1 Tax=Teredinibacter purpureus TaxID=2731756 RepID=UPI0005F808CB|nr:ATP-binding protein [Teredinibacter purpureus]
MSVIINIEKDQPLEHPQQNLQQLIYGLSHDMGAPLRAVVQFSLLLSRNLDAKLNDKERYWLQLIQENGEQAQSMIAALLQYSRLETHRETLKPFTIDEALQLALRKLQPQLLETNATIDYVPSACEINGDAEQWQLYFYCVLENALKFHSPTTDIPPQIRIRIDNTPNTITICVEDNGIGVNEKHWIELSRPFKRLNRQEEYPGIGMGLGYCERITQLHGGHLEFSSSPLGGLCITCTLAQA